MLCVGVFGWRGLLPRNRFAGVRTPASLRSDAAFLAANRVAAAPLVAAAAVATTGGVLCFGVTSSLLAVVAGVTGAGTVALVLAGGLLGDRAARAVRHDAACSDCPASSCLAKG